MEAVLYVSHGSRIAAARHEAARFVEQCRRAIDIPIQELCFVELAEPDIVTGVDRCVAQGATRVIVVPLLLLSAGHAKHDIPAALDIARRRHPSVDILCGAPFGVHEAMIDIMIDRISEQSAPLDVESMILLVGRGSSDPDTKRDMSAIAALLKEKRTCRTWTFVFSLPSARRLMKGSNGPMHRRIGVCLSSRTYCLPAS